MLTLIIGIIDPDPEWKKFAKIIPSSASLSSTRYKTEVPIARSIELLQLKLKQIRIAAKNYILQKNKKNISSSSSMSSSSMSRMTGRSSSVVFTATQTLLILTKNIIDVQHRECVVLQWPFVFGCQSQHTTISGAGLAFYSTCLLTNCRWPIWAGHLLWVMTCNHWVIPYTHETKNCSPKGC